MQLLEEREAQLARANKVIENLQSIELSKSETDSKTEIEEKCSKLEQLVIDLRKQNEESIKQLQCRKNDLDEENMDLQTKLKSSVKETAEDEVVMLKREIDALKTQINRLSQDAATEQGIEPQSGNLAAEKEVALLQAKELVLLDLCENVALERNIEAALASDIEEQYKMAIAKEEQLSKRVVMLARKFKFARAKLEKESKEHEKTKEKLDLVAKESVQVAESNADICDQKFIKLREESDARIKALEECVQDLAESKETLEKKVLEQGDQIRLYVSEKSNLEAEMRAFHERTETLDKTHGAELLEAESKIKKQKEEIDEAESLIKTLKAQLAKAQKQIQEQKSKSRTDASAPPGFSVRKHVLCSVTVRDIVWACVDVVSREQNTDTTVQSPKLQWYKTDDIQNWLLNAENEDNDPLPVPLEIQFRREHQKELAEARGETAAVLNELETHRSELAQYKRRAQIALRKAQEEASKAVGERLGEQDQLVSQLQTELSNMVRTRDTLQETIEKMRTENAALKISVREANMDVESTRKLHSELESSIQHKLHSLRSDIEREQEELFKDEREGLLREIKHAQENVEKSEKRIQNVQQDYASLQEELETERAETLPLKNTLKNLQARNEELLESVSKLKNNCSDLEKRAKEVSSRHTESDTIPNLNPNISQSEPSEKRQNRQNSYFGDTDSSSIPLLFNSLQRQQEEERIQWQNETQKNAIALEAAESEKRKILNQVAELQEQLDNQKRSAGRQQHLAEKEEALTYLKNVILKYVAAKDMSEKKTLLPVLGTMLQFDNKEMKAAEQAMAENERGFLKSVSGFF
eukprot:CAMPEP_0204874280 /NCGR_PEP_ID=MMETSP1348-20121228/42689_1 /ASSEMBLY_ACC=CAM_ASM_000700 /TAXON_ID=215587 /ORGANISM="Aplanochytrium stocchinoi, Strain GSBS06" /LENGTH=815 /DNA_ID=CAMNT_0052030005 /DNA_START=39 /DNA_END=2486 /DNA_ORIENTATION=+